ncbi:hypothetical protein LIER_33922 [Lithospermum erythrorhizon]|uniref:Uncharacterized protein n=1 Tax=Lithospermum erythrorhizon TaxID=34254 RepID=A0AAV3S1R3_LITER
MGSDPQDAEVISLNPRRFIIPLPLWDHPQLRPAPQLPELPIPLKRVLIGAGFSQEGIYGPNEHRLSLHGYPPPPPSSSLPGKTPVVENRPPMFSKRQKPIAHKRPRSKILDLTKDLQLHHPKKWKSLGRTQASTPPLQNRLLRADRLNYAHPGACEKERALQFQVKELHEENERLKADVSYPFWRRGRRKIKPWRRSRSMNFFMLGLPD